MRCPRCGYEQEDSGLICQRCGSLGPNPGGGEAEEPRAGLLQALLYVRPEINIVNFGGRAVLYIALIVFGAICVLSPLSYENAPMRFLHMVNLPFHEAGHIIFGLFGFRLLGAAGGSLMQVLVPLVCAAAFLLQTRDTFASSVGVWWTGESLMDLAPYINDARSLSMVLLGGVTGREVEDYHDWQFILRELGLLRQDHAIAYAAYGVGAGLMLLSLAWGGYLLYKQSRRLS